MAACTGSHTSDTAFFDKETLRDISMGREKGTVWTRELESVRLVRAISELPQVSKEIPLEPLVVTVADTGKALAYPELAGFGSLDTGSLSPDLLHFLDSFCNTVSLWDIPSENLSDTALFSIILFRHDILEGWRSAFDADFPIQMHSEAAKESAAQADEPRETAADATQKKDGHAKEKAPPPVKRPKVFTSALYGAPFIEADKIAVPIRFYAEAGYVDTELFISTGAASPPAEGERKTSAAAAQNPVDKETANDHKPEETEKPAKRPAAEKKDGKADAATEKETDAGGGAPSDGAKKEAAGKTGAQTSGDFKINQIQIMRWGKNGK